MFISFLRISPTSFKLIDDEFECVVNQVNLGSESVSMAVAIVREYGKRGLNIGKNLALGVIWWSEELDKEGSRINIKWIVNTQNMLCPRHIKNWSEYAMSRDEWIQKFMVWK